MNIRPLTPADKEAYSFLMRNAYPGFGPGFPPGFREVIYDYRMTHDDMTLYGAFIDEALVGSYRYHRYTMNLRGARLPISGLGGVAVDLPHKKKHVALDMVRDFHRESLARGVALATLYPFRIDFYARMGYGTVSRIHMFELKTTDFPAGDFSACSWIDDEAVWLDVYNRQAAVRHGMIARDATFYELGRLLGRQPRPRVGVWRDGRVTGMMQMEFGPASSKNPFDYEMDIREIFYETPADLRALMAFIRAQQDQVARVRLHTFDPDFACGLESLHSAQAGVNILDEFHMGETLGYGLMARVLDVKALRAALAGARLNADAELVFEIHDDLLPRNTGRWDWVIADGRLCEQAASAAAPVVKLSIADFSAFICGAVGLQSLWRHSRLETSTPERLAALDLAFQTPTFECWTVF